MEALKQKLEEKLSQRDLEQHSPGITIVSSFAIFGRDVYICYIWQSYILSVRSLHNIIYKI